MARIINFFLDQINQQYLIGLILVTAAGTVFFGAFYFFAYSYFINKRLKSPEKKHRIKLVMPRFACIMIAAAMIVGYHAVFQPRWVSDHSYVYTNETYTYDEMAKNDSFTLYQADSGLFRYSVFYNNDFNGITTKNIKNCEYVVFVDFIGGSKEITKNFIGNAAVINIESTGDLRYGVGNAVRLKNFPLTYHGVTDAYDMISIEVSVFSPENYRKYEKQLYSDNIDENFDEMDYISYSEQIKFDLTEKKLSSVKIR